MTEPAAREGEAEGRRVPDRRAILRAAAWLVGGAAGVRLIDGFFADNPAAAAVLGALLVDLLAGRAGVRWSERAKVPWWPDSRAGLLVGGTIGMATLAIGHAGGWATIVIGAPTLSLVFAALRVVAAAARDELLLRVLPVVLGRRAGVPAAALATFCAVAAAAPLLASRAELASVALAASLGLLGAQLALATRGAVASIAAHAGFALVIGPLSRGGVLDVRWWQGDPGPPPLAQGVIAWVAAALVAVVALVVVPRVLPARPPDRTEM